MSAHIIGRPNDDLLDIILGHGADPEQAFIAGSQQGPEEGANHVVADLRFLRRSVGARAYEPRAPRQPRRADWLL